MKTSLFQYANKSFRQHYSTESKYSTMIYVVNKRIVYIAVNTLWQVK